MKKTNPNKYIDSKAGCPLVDPFQQILDKLEALSVKVDEFEDTMLHELGVIQNDIFCGKVIGEGRREK